MAEDKRPDLHGAALGLVARVTTLHTTGSGMLPLSEVVQLFGLIPTPEEQLLLTARGNFTFNAVPDTPGGNFVNVGEEASIVRDNLRVTVQSKIEGTYQITAGTRISLKFSPGHTLFGSVKVPILGFIGKIPLQTIDVDDAYITIDLQGAQFDKVIDHRLTT